MFVRQQAAVWQYIPPSGGLGGSTTMRNKAARDAKRKAYAEKKEQEGRSVINWIFGALVALAVLFAAYTCMSVG